MVSSDCKMYRVELVKHKDRVDELLALSKTSFKREKSADLWNWKYCLNPSYSSNPEIIVAFDEDEIIGARPFISLCAWIKQEKVKAALFCDTMVHSDHRRKGIFWRMNEFAIKYLSERDYAFIYNFPMPISFIGYLKQGWKCISSTEMLFRMIKLRKLITLKLKKSFSNSTSSLSYKLQWGDTRAHTKKPISSDSFQVIISDKYLPELRHVDDLRDKNMIHFVRDEKFLKWRFDQHPKKNYRYILLKKEDELIGYAVIGIENRTNGLIHGLISDFLIKHDHIDCFRAMINQCITELEESDCDLISLWAFSHQKFRKELLDIFCFKSSLRFPYNKIHKNGYFIIRRLISHPAIYDIENWRITYAHKG
ncbi:GNAT family N-acetyltransferase [[Eubacterium] cellulosolvens]